MSVKSLGIAAAVGAALGVLWWLTAGSVSLLVTRVYRGVDRWRNWQSASSEKWAQTKAEEDRLGDRFDVWPTDLESVE